MAEPHQVQNHDRKKIRKEVRQVQAASMAIGNVPYRLQVDYDGVKYDIVVPELSIPKCSHCGALSIDEAADEQIDNAFRQKAHLLTKEQIRMNREALKLTHQELARRLGLAEDIPARWEAGTQIQRRSSDTLMRLFFGLEAVQSVLGDEGVLHQLGTSVSARA